MTDLGTLCLLLTDLHFGKRTRFGFDSDTARERLLEIPGRLAVEAELARRRRVVVLLDGDLAEGELVWETQAAEVEAPMIDQVRVCTEALWGLLAGLHRVARKAAITVISVPGNHGKIGGGAHPSSCADNQIADNLAALAREGRRPWLTVKADHDPIRCFTVDGHRYVMMHRGPKHVRTPALEVKALRWMRANRASCVIGGHWHRAEVVPVSDGWVITGGSLCGPDEFAESLALYDPARQVWFSPTPHSPVGTYGFLEWPHDT